MQLEITAVVVTHDRAAYLPGAVRSLAAQDLAPERYEILVVTNACSDATPRVLRELAAEVPNLRCVDEPRLGVSHARNTGWREARSRYVAYLDDDAVAAPDWLRRVLEVFAARRPEPGCVGGSVEPIWEVPRPPWLPDSVLPFLTVLDAGPRPTGMRGVQFLYGTNSAFPRRRLEEVGGFRPDLGPIGRWHRTGEDTLVQKEIRALGHEIVYDPSLRVRHHLQKERLQPRWVLRRMYWEGIGHARQLLHERRTGPGRRAALTWRAFRRLVNSPRRLLVSALPCGDRPRRFERKATTWRRLGTVAGLLGAGSRES